MQVMQIRQNKALKDFFFNEHSNLNNEYCIFALLMLVFLVFD